ncbi:MAG: site-specific integrase [Planctomycetota bacterium]|jgi:integrase
MTNKVGIYHDPRKKHPWVVRWYGEYDPKKGKQKRYSKSFRLRRNAEEFKSEKATAFRKGRRRDRPNEITIKDFCDDWLKTKSPEIREGSKKLYQATIDRLVGYFGPNTLISQVKPITAAKFIAEMKPEDKDKEQLSGWTRHKILRNSKAIFEAAVTWELIGKNPFKNVNAPKLIITPWHYLKPEGYKKLLKVAPKLQYKAMYALGYTAGLRFGEMYSLTWNCIDFETGEVIVQNRPATPTMPPFFIKDYESRRIPLPKHTLDILTELQTQAPEKVPFVLLDEQQYQTMLSKWKKCQEEGLPWENQKMVNNIRREFKRRLEWAGVKPKGTLSIHVFVEKLSERPEESKPEVRG